MLKSLDKKDNNFIGQIFCFTGFFLIPLFFSGELVSWAQAQFTASLDPFSGRSARPTSRANPKRLKPRAHGFIMLMICMCSFQEKESFLVGWLF
ncbi:hypothetical protein VNO80_08259 [Phaseolus coccineus]|uniref:Uncharacterized protein n=1 Tax=Phaseolus coccineus TaxID=3886 RepID=A0AAN9NL76_PHACN